MAPISHTPHGVRLLALGALRDALENPPFALEASRLLSLAATRFWDRGDVLEEMASLPWQEAALLASFHLANLPPSPGPSRWQVQYRLLPRVHALLLEGQARGALGKTLSAHRFLLQDLDDASLRLILSFAREGRHLGRRFFHALEDLILVCHLQNLSQAPSG